MLNPDQTHGHDWICRARGSVVLARLGLEATGFGLAWPGPGLWKRNILNNQEVAKMDNSYHRTKWSW